MLAAQTRIAALMAFVLPAMFGSVAAQQGAPTVSAVPAVAVLELFTSQGCPSCPPADALLAEVGARPDIVALAYHVDYWDYVGWTDTFGSKRNSDRQRAYATVWDVNGLYTPQLVVNGGAYMVGSRRAEIQNHLSQATLPLAVQLSVAGGVLVVDIAGKPGFEPSMVWLVTYRDQANVKVERGENAGRTLTYTHIVTGRQLIGLWDPGAGAHMRLPLAEVLTPQSNGLAILVQPEEGGLPGAMLGAAAISP